MNHPTVFAFSLGPQELLIILAVGVLLFGRRLPEVGRSLGKGIVEFKKGLHGIEDEIDQGARASAPAPHPEVPTRVPTNPTTAQPSV